MAGFLDIFGLDQEPLAEPAQVLPKIPRARKKTPDEEDAEEWTPPWLANPPPTVYEEPAPAPPTSTPPSRFSSFLDELDALNSPAVPGIPGASNPEIADWYARNGVSIPTPPAPVNAPTAADVLDNTKPLAERAPATSFFDWARNTAQENVLGKLMPPRPANDPGRGVLGDRLGMLSPDDRKAAAESELETAATMLDLSSRARDAIPADLAPDAVKERVAAAREKIKNGDVQAGIEELVAELGVGKMAKSVARGVVGSYADQQATRLKVAQEMVAGKRELPEKTAWRNAFETGARTLSDTFASGYLKTLPIVAHLGNQATKYMPGWDPTESSLYKLGESIEAAAKRAFPGDKARQFEFTTTLAQGVASTAAFAGQGVVMKMAGMGEKGVLAAIALSGAALQTPGEFEAVTKAMKEGTATERDRIIVTLSNLGLGATEALPFAPSLAKGSVGFRAGLLRAAEQALEEGGQEGLQQLGQNLTRKKTYKPDQDLYEGVAEGMSVGALTGGAFGGLIKSHEDGEVVPSGSAQPVEAPRQELGHSSTEHLLDTPWGVVDISNGRAAKRMAAITERLHELEDLANKDYEAFVNDGLEEEYKALKAKLLGRVRPGRDQ